MLRYEFHPSSPYPWWISAPIPKIPQQNLREAAFDNRHYRKSGSRYEGTFYKFRENIVRQASAIMAPYASLWIRGENLNDIKTWMIDHAENQYLRCDRINTSDPYPDPYVWSYQIRFWDQALCAEFTLRFWDIGLTAHGA